MSEQFEAMSELVISGEVEGVKALVEEALAGGASPQDVLRNGLLPGMDVVGEQFKIGEMYIPEVLMSARAMAGAMEILKPLLTDSEVAGAGTIVIGTVEGDIHNIGKDLVGMMLEGAGFKVINLGIDVTPDAFVKAAIEHDADIIAMSALLTTTMPRMKTTVDALREAGLGEKVMIIAGGAPVNEEYVKNIGGHAYAPDAAVAVEKARALMAQRA
jgi:5-methyltetrahydrofolate--homocysteine methyltransferase